MRIINSHHGSSTLPFTVACVFFLFGPLAFSQENTDLAKNKTESATKQGQATDPARPVFLLKSKPRLGNQDSKIEPLYIFPRIAEPRVEQSEEVEPGDVSPHATDVKTVIAAIEAEANGDLATRSKLLVAAIELGNLIPARWQAGQIQDGKRWTSIEEFVALAKDNKLLQEYSQKRAGSQDNVESNLRLADWCVEVGLMPQARAHLERVIDIEPDHELARNELGYRRVGNDWISPQEIAKISESHARYSAVPLPH